MWKMCTNSNVHHFKLIQIMYAFDWKQPDFFCKLFNKISISFSFLGFFKKLVLILSTSAMLIDPWQSSYWCLNTRLFFLSVTNCVIFGILDWTKLVNGSLLSFLLYEQHWINGDFVTKYHYSALSNLNKSNKSQETRDSSKLFHITACSLKIHTYPHNHISSTICKTHTHCKHR